jgi:hypothetical protein
MPADTSAPAAAEPRDQAPRSLLRRDVGKPFGRRELFEVLAVILTGILNIAPLERIGIPQAAFIVVVTVAWGLYIASRLRRDGRRQLAEWGITARNFGSAMVATSVFGVLSIGALAILAGPILDHEMFGLYPRMLIMAAGYPIWGLVQQLIVQGIVAGNLSRLLDRPWMSPTLIVAICGGLFGLAHATGAGHDWKLVLATAVMGLIFTPIFLRWRNIWPLALWHGWLGAFMYTWIMQQNPLNDIFVTLN